MASQHFLALALFVTLTVTLAVSLPNDVIAGSRIPGDRLIQREEVKKDASWVGMKVTITKTFEGDKYSKISQLRALDQHSNGHGATAKIIAGGVGFSYVTIKFESERFRGIDFVVELYGK
ncbi:hypothetical protein TSAR_008649 [Trichomalopsis sarcophagae]|uniref:Salivary secreted peptide n=1 Tax=Trichomalopsis sarcophagae TaxID=543379 RepID=A0A232F274_9HYME|nr:hypothetical protein TSAR_008649 [Trichomalopsis sarcophagae]